MNGILVIDKPSDITSRDVVNRVGRILGTKKVGHTGTLDPLATGVMVICVGVATKLVEIITADEKEYIAKVMLGVQNDTGDITGNIEAEESVQIPNNEIERACRRMTKTYEQTVPIYSAVKINGKKLYEYARNGEEIPLPKRKVTIFSCHNTPPSYENGKTIFTLQTKVSKGTYIRSLITDLAQELGTVGTMVELRRTQQGSYTIEESQTLEELESGVIRFQPYKKVFDSYPKIIVDPILEQKIKNGCRIPDIYQENIIYLENQEGSPLALYHKDENHLGEMKIWKMLVGLEDK